MKNTTSTSTLLSVISLTSLLSISNVFGGDTRFDAYIESNLTVAVSAISNAPSLPDRDSNGNVIKNGGFVFENFWSTSKGSVTTDRTEIGSIIAGTRFSNREILTEAILGQQIDTTISGWALRLITPVEPAGFKSAERAIWMPQSSTRIIAVKKGKSPVEISSLEVLRGSPFRDGSANFTRTFDSSTQKETFRQNGLFSMIRQIEVEMELFDFQIGFFALEDTKQFFDPRVDDQSASVFLPLTSTYIILSSDVSFGSFGSLQKDEDFESETILLGEATTRSPRLVNVPTIVR